MVPNVMLRRILLIMVFTTLAVSAANAQTPDSPGTPPPASTTIRTEPTDPDRVPWDDVSPELREQIPLLMADVNWPIRVFALLRLERYSGAEPQAFIHQAISDSAWQVRCFAIRAAAATGMAIDPTILADEKDPKVLRAALRAGVALPHEQIKPHAQRLLKTRGIEELVLGLELAACSDIEDVRIEAQSRAVRLIRNMDESVALLITRRLATIFGLHRPFETAAEWRLWLAGRGEKVPLAASDFARRSHGRVGSPIITGMDDEAFTRLLDYLSSLKQRDLDLVLVMDATASMIPMVNQVRAGIDSLILFLSDISRNMRIAFVGYRDHDNPPVWDGHPFTTDINSIRRYLFDLRISGGADYPEAVLDGLQATAKLDWNRKAEREIVVVGDAPPHEKDLYQVRALLDGMRDSGVTVHAVHVPMDYPPGTYERLTPMQAEERRLWLENYNKRTGEVFAEIADNGGGKKARLTQADQLVPSIMRFTIEEGWWSAFDEFYEAYLDVCR